MNKQELIKKLKELLTTPSEVEGYDFEHGHDFGIERAITLAEQLDEQGKPVVPQFVADWYEENKDDFERNLYNFFRLYHEGLLQRDLDDWFTNNINKPIETLAKMKLFGYEVDKEKEKLYTVELPNPNSAGGKIVLNKQQSTGRLILEMLTPDINKPKYLHLTESEIKEDFEWAWKYAKEVE